MGAIPISASNFKTIGTKEVYMGAIPISASNFETIGIKLFLIQL